MNTIHIIPNPTGLMPYLTYWHEAFGNYGFDVKVYEPAEYSLKWKKPGEYEYRAGTAYELFKNWNVQSGDVIIVVDSWNPITQMIMDYKLTTATDIRIFGFWTYNPYNSESKVWKVMKKEPDTRTWYYNMTKNLYGCYDYNCFFNDSHLDEFTRRQLRRNKEKFLFRKKLYVTGWPLDRVFENDTKLEDKENIVLLPLTALNAAQRTLLTVIESQFPDWKFVYLQRSKPSRVSYLKYLKKAKIIFLNKKWEYDPTMIVEAMNYGVYPLIPNTRVAYRFTFPDKYWYNPLILDPSLRYVNKTLWAIKNREGLIQRFADAMENYESRYDEIIQDAKSLTQQYFNSENFRKILFGSI